MMKKFFVLFLVCYAASAYSATPEEAITNILNTCFENGSEACNKGFIGDGEAKNKLLLMAEFLYQSQQFKELVVSQYGQEAYLKLQKVSRLKVPAMPEPGDFTVAMAEKNKAVVEHKIGGRFPLVRKEGVWYIDAVAWKPLNSEMMPNQEQLQFINYYKNLLVALQDRIIRRAPALKYIKLQMGIGMMAFIYNDELASHRQEMKDAREMVESVGMTIEEVKSHYLKPAR